MAVKGGNGLRSAGLAPRDVPGVAQGTFRPGWDLIRKTRLRFYGSLGRELIDCMQSRLIAEPLVKNAGALGWSEVGTAEAALIQRCAAGEQVA